MKMLRLFPLTAPDYPRNHSSIAASFIISFLLFFHTLSFAQTEGIRGIRFKDGTIVYGSVVNMNVYDVHIQMKDGTIISRKFDDVETFIKSGDKEEAHVKSEIFSISIGTERMSGNTTYQIGYPVIAPDGTQTIGYFPFSKLEWPLDLWLVRMDTFLKIGDAWQINGVIKKNLSDPGDKMKDLDWLTPSDPGRLDLYSESTISKLDALVCDVDVEWIFLNRKSWLLFTGLGYQYQQYEYDATLIHQYSPSGLPDSEAYGDGRVAIAYKMNYAMPYLKIGTDLRMSNKFTLAASFAWSPVVKAEDEDHHYLRENGGKISTGDMEGDAYILSVSARYKITPSWFLKGGFHYSKINVDGEQRQIYANGDSIGTVKEKSESTQISGYLSVGYIF